MKREIHPLADLIPPMSASEFAELRDSIKADGLRVPTTLHTDGPERQTAAVWWDASAAGAGVSLCQSP
jgi:hypothetical protein